MPLYMIFTLTILATIFVTHGVEVGILTALGRSGHWHMPWWEPDRNPIARRLRHPSLGILIHKANIALSSHIL